MFVHHVQGSVNLHNNNNNNTKEANVLLTFNNLKVLVVNVAHRACNCY